MRTSRWWFAAAAILVVALAAGCSGGKSKSKTPTSSASDGATPKATANATTAATSSSGGSGSSADVPDVKDMAKKFANATFQATYRVTGGGDVVGGDMLIYKDGKDRFRFDITASQDGQTMSIMFIQNGDTSAFCLKDAGELGPLLGIEAGKGVCFESDPNDPNNPVGDISTTFEDIENADVTVLETSKRKVAGRDAFCYRAKENSSEDISTICFASDGAMLYVQTEGYRRQHDRGDGREVVGQRFQL